MKPRLNCEILWRGQCDKEQEDFPIDPEELRILVKQPASKQTLQQTQTRVRKQSTLYGAWKLPQPCERTSPENRGDLLPGCDRNKWEDTKDSCFRPVSICIVAT